MEPKRRFYLLGMVLLWCCGVVTACGGSGEVAAEQSQRPLETAFVASGADFARWYLAGWGTLQQETFSEGELADRGKEVCRELGVEITGHTSQQAGDSMTILYTGMKGLHQYEVLLQKLPTETYLIININSPVGEGEMGKEEMLLRETLAGYVQEPDISAMIKGYLPERYTERSGKKTLTKMIEGADGIVVEKTVEAGYMSFTGYSERLEQSVLVGTKKVNLQCALSYDETQGNTLVLLATPLIFAEY